ncbi:hypothetical protein JW710_02015 [Candidatus Dojkabacteria bacterium]|nr:hypothetical protein [Candidatus Dojkabacteria bacterium]
MSRYSYSDRYTVEDSRKISVSDLKRLGFFKGSKWDTVIWKLYEEETARVSIHVDVFNYAKSIRFVYTVTDHSTGEKKDYDYSFPIVTTPCSFGGHRYWIECGLVKDGDYCGNRVSTLYMAPNSHYFGCRKCMDLNYKSQRISYNGSFGYFKKMLDLYEKRDKLKGEIKRTLYNGEFTKKFQKLLELEKMIAGVSKSDLYRMFLK